MTSPLYPTGRRIERGADELPLVLFVDIGDRVRVLCESHRTQLYPKLSGVPVSELEQKQSKLFFGAPVRCESCTGMVAR